MLSDEVQSVATLPHEVYCTDIHWYPTSAVTSKKPLAQSELFVLACTDGKLINIHVMVSLPSCRPVPAGLQGWQSGEGSRSTQRSGAGYTLGSRWYYFVDL